MNNKTITLRDDEEYITLGVMLKIAGLIDTGGMAKAFLANNVVYINDEADNRRGRKLYRGAVVRVGNKVFSIE
ncbi:MAG: RNA-binding S4 domain-containing protein [Bacilli bacterium]|nr:RNA-binding S4 domain-containing protein [Bacilli bacterium]